MAAGISIKFLLLVMMSGAMLRQVNEAPPRDLASLVAPKTVLQQLGVADDEAGLIALLGAEGVVTVTGETLRQAVADLGAEGWQTRKDAAERLLAAGAMARPYLEAGARSDDPEVRLTAKELLEKLSAAKAEVAGDTEYVKKLYAIRTLEEMKSKQAIPALKVMVKGRDITLGEAAREALAVIRGDEMLKQPLGVGTLNLVAKQLPQDVGFVGVLDFARNRRARSLRDYVGKVFVQGRVAGDDAVARQVENMVAGMEREIPKLVALIGNVRVDSVTMLTSDRIGEREEGYVAWVFKGLWEPARLRAACVGNFTGEMEVSGHKVYFEGYGPAFCFLDEHTAVISVGPGRNGDHIREVVTALGGKERGEPAAHLAGAFARVRAGKERLAAAGRLSAMQKAMLKQELEGDIPRMRARVAEGRPGMMRQIELSLCELCLALVEVDRFTAHLTLEGKVVAEAESGEGKVSEKVNVALIELEKVIRARIAVRNDRVPPGFQSILSGIKGDARLWQSRTEQNKVTAEAVVDYVAAFLTAF